MSAKFTYLSQGCTARECRSWEAHPGLVPENGGSSIDLIDPATLGGPCCQSPHLISLTIIIPLFAFSVVVVI